jgi:hypothetical protein
MGKSGASAEVFGWISLDGDAIVVVKREDAEKTSPGASGGAPSTGRGLTT